MIDITPLRKEKGVRALLNQIKEEVSTLDRKINIMEVCGTHTMTAYRSGLGWALRKMGINLISGPGCPVCVTPDSIISSAVFLVKRYSSVILASFGDMLKVPASDGVPLMKLVPAENSEIRIIYSTEEVLKLAMENPQKEVVFLAAGFETTIPSIAWLLKRAKEKKIKNISILPAMKLVPPPLKAILESGEIKLDGFIYPGHVSVIIGSEPYRFIPEKYGIAGAIAGFEPADLLFGILSVLRQIKLGKPDVDIVYKRAVKPEGNPVAKDLMREVFHVEDAEWRGFGVIPESGLFPEKGFSAFERFELKPEAVWESKGCRCGDVVKGVAQPEDCPLFKKVCTPDSPRGACMVSIEGACLIHFKYGEEVSFEGD
jgi:hydrogenase expression/formation protein HypD